MIARLQQFITLAALLCVGALIALGPRLGHPGWAALGVALVLFGHAVFLALEAVLSWLVHGDDPVPRASAGQWLQAWWSEVRLAPLVFCWRQPFRARAEPDHLPAVAVGRRGVLLVHGLLCNRGFWNPWMRQLRALDVPFVAFDMDPPFAGIDEFTPAFEQALQRLEAATGRPPLVVAHSMGGLVVRAWLQAGGDIERLQHVITIGTPHHGTWLARLGHSDSAAQMALRGEWIAALWAAEPASYRQRFTCVYSACDNVVFPPSVATLPEARNLHVPGVAHVQLAFAEAVFDEALRRLKQA